MTRDWLYVATPGFVPGAGPAGLARAQNAPTPAPKSRPGELLIDETEPTWRLFDRPAARRNPWHSLVLRRTGRRLPKRAYWLGWNGNRLALGHDAKILLGNDPEIFNWVEIACSSHQWEPER